MHCNRIERHGKQIKGHRVKKPWGKLTDDDLDAIDGRLELRPGRGQRRYGMARNDVDRQIDAWASTAGGEGFARR